MNETYVQGQDIQTCILQRSLQLLISRLKNLHNLFIEKLKKEPYENTEWMFPNVLYSTVDIIKQHLQQFCKISKSQQKIICQLLQKWNFLRKLLQSKEFKLLQQGSFDHFFDKTIRKMKAKYGEQWKEVWLENFVKQKLEREELVLRFEKLIKKQEEEAHRKATEKIILFTKTPKSSQHDSVDDESETNNHSTSANTNQHSTEDEPPVVSLFVKQSVQEYYWSVKQNEKIISSTRIDATMEYSNRIQYWKEEIDKHNKDRFYYQFSQLILDIASIEDDRERLHAFIIRLKQFGKYRSIFFNSILHYLQTHLQLQHKRDMIQAVFDVVTELEYGLPEYKWYDFWKSSALHKNYSLPTTVSKSEIEISKQKLDERIQQYREAYVFTIYYYLKEVHLANYAQKYAELLQRIVKLEYSIREEWNEMNPSSQLIIMELSKYMKTLPCSFTGLIFVLWQTGIPKQKLKASNSNGTASEWQQYVQRSNSQIQLQSMRFSLWIQMIQFSKFANLRYTPIQSLNGKKLQAEVGVMFDTYLNSDREASYFNRQVKNSHTRKTTDLFSELVEESVAKRQSRNVSLFMQSRELMNELLSQQSVIGTFLQQWNQKLVEI